MEDPTAQGGTPLGSSLTDLHMRINLVFQLQQNCMRPRSTELGLGPGQPRILSYVTAHPGCTQREIANYFEIDPSAVSRMLEALARGGFITFTRGEDRRCKVAELTDKGRETIAAWDRECQAIDEVMYAGLEPSERKVVDTVLDHLHRALSEEAARRNDRGEVMAIEVGARAWEEAETRA